MKSSSPLCCRNLLWISIIGILFTSSTLVVRISETSASPATHFFVDPSEIRDVQPSNTFSIRINISEAPTTYSWEVYLNWDRNLLNVSGIKEGDFLHRWEEDPFNPGVWYPKYSTGFAYTPLNEANNAGEMLVDCSLLGDWPLTDWASGNGWLVTLNFTVTDWGRSLLNLSKTCLWDHLADDPPHWPESTYYDNVDSFFTNFHDIVVSDATASPTEVTKPDSVFINVNVTNNGDFTETFNVTAYYDSIAIEKQTSITLNAGANTTLNFEWNTTYVAAGTYTIKAMASTVPNEANTTNNMLIDGSVIVNAAPNYPVADFTFSPQKPLIGETVVFNSTSYDDDGYIVSWEWDLDSDDAVDATTENATWIYMGAGQYTVRLVVTDNATLSSGIQKLITIYAPPVAGFTYSPTNPLINEIVTFDASVSYDLDGTIVDYSWDFDDGQTGSGETTSHTYTNLGNYIVTLTVTDDDDLTGTESMSLYVIKAPAASFTYTPSSPLVNQTVTFDAASSTPNGGSINSYLWDFGDGSSADETDPIASHAYIQAGSYTVSLTVTDSEGLTGTTTQSIVIGKLSSTISVSASPLSITAGDEVTIAGAVTPKRIGATVTIWYKLSGADSWLLLETLTTDDNSQYSYDWTPAAAGTYEVKAKWDGDSNTLGKESGITTVTVQEAPGLQDMYLYLIAGLIIVIAVAIAVYYFKFRKKASN